VLPFLSVSCTFTSAGSVDAVACGRLKVQSNAWRLISSKIFLRSAANVASVSLWKHSFVASQPAKRAVPPATATGERFSAFAAWRALSTSPMTNVRTREPCTPACAAATTFAMSFDTPLFPHDVGLPSVSRMTDFAPGFVDAFCAPIAAVRAVASGVPQ
jgi:hypothetical protein